MGGLKDFAKKVPAYHLLRDRYVAGRLKAKSAEDVFTEIYRKNTWHGRDSVSGTGSDHAQTEVVARELPVLCREFGVASMLDIPCGDFHWFRNVDLQGVAYTGADIVKELIQKNRESYQRDNVQFRDLNLLEDDLPPVDLVFCRDCLVHFSYRDIRRALTRICESRAGLLLTTTFTDRPENRDIATGQWRVLNLEAAPFLLPRPLRVINEECTEEGGAYADKSLALWRTADIREILAGPNA